MTENNDIIDSGVGAEGLDDIQTLIRLGELGSLVTNMLCLR